MRQDYPDNLTMKDFFGISGRNVIYLLYQNTYHYWFKTSAINLYFTTKPNHHLKNVKAIDFGYFTAQIN
jgi:hypothetical protein